MKGNEVTQEDMKRWKKQGYIPVSCRLCGEIMLFPKKTYRKDQLSGYECGGTLCRHCAETTHKIMRLY